MGGAERACGECGTPCPGHAPDAGKAQWTARMTGATRAAKRAKRGRERASRDMPPGSRVQPDHVRDSDVPQLHAAAATNATADAAGSCGGSEAIKPNAPGSIPCER